jgi:hypothetical protein
MSSKPPTVRELRRFGLTLSVGVFLGFFLIAPWLRGAPRPLWPIVASAVVLSTALAAPRLLRPVQLASSKVATAIGAVQLRITLVVLFFGLWVPFGLVLRLFRRDPLGLSWDTASKSYRREPHRRPERPFEKPY